MSFIYRSCSLKVFICSIYESSQSMILLQMPLTPNELTHYGGAYFWSQCWQYTCQHRLKESKADTMMGLCISRVFQRVCKIILCPWMISDIVAQGSEKSSSETFGLTVYLKVIRDPYIDFKFWVTDLCLEKQPRKLHFIFGIKITTETVEKVSTVRKMYWKCQLLSCYIGT